jgi:hypothetical protein
MLLPTPVIDQGPCLTRAEARLALGIPKSEMVLLSMGSPAKYLPIDAADFFATAVKILNQNLNAHVYLLGVAQTDRLDYLRRWHHDRFHFLGRVEDPSLYQAAADVYLEGFPMTSQTALLETALKGVPPVLAFEPIFSLLAANDPALEGIVDNPLSEHAYIERANLLIRDNYERERVGNDIKEHVFAYHVGDIWHEHLQKVYEYTGRLSHHPQAIPNSSLMATKDDLGLSIYQHSRGNATNLANVVRERLRDFAPAGLRQLLSASVKLTGARPAGRYMGLVMILLRSWIHYRKRMLGQAVRALSA